MLKPEPITAPQPGQADLNDRALVVNSGDGMRMYGRWDVFFSAWERGLDEVEWREVLPQRSVLTPAGRWRADALQSLMGPEADALPDTVTSCSVDAYFSLIPTHIRRLAAPFDTHQWLMMDVMWMVPEVRFALDEITLPSQMNAFSDLIARENLVFTPQEQRGLYFERFDWGNLLTLRADVT